jgi:hypothetical protein
MAKARRRRLRRFIRDGLPATAEITDISLEKAPFDGRIALVAYEFRADGALHRDVDQILPAIAARWRRGDEVRVLYIAEDAWDSVILTA